MIKPIWSRAALCAGIVAAALLAGCSSESGGGSEPAAPSVVVLPSGAHVVCRDGSAPPCD